jgi:hypothetical protein
MLKIKNSKIFTYHEKGIKVFTVISGELSVLIGTPKIGFKSDYDGFNHKDLALGALLNFFCWPPQKLIVLQNKEILSIEPFVPYNLSHTGVYDVKGDFSGEYKFYLP